VNKSDLQSPPPPSQIIFAMRFFWIAVCAIKNRSIGAQCTKPDPKLMRVMLLSLWGVKTSFDCPY
jgi:hypothetical protein